MGRRPILIVKTGSGVPVVGPGRGDFEDWIARGLGSSRRTPSPARAVMVISVFEGERLPLQDGVSGVVVTGSAAFVSERESWSERTGDWLAEAAAGGTPVLGICYGHQLLAHALGGRVGRNPAGREIGTAEIDLGGAVRAGDPLLGALPRRVHMQVTHVESVLELPAGARRLGASEVDPNQAFAWGERAWGLQFHPEFDAAVIRSYVESRADELRSEGIDPEEVHRGVRESPHGDTILRRFAEIVDAD